MTVQSTKYKKANNIATNGHSGIGLTHYACQIAESKQVTASL